MSKTDIITKCNHHPIYPICENCRLNNKIISLRSELEQMKARLIQSYREERNSSAIADEVMQRAEQAEARVKELEARHDILCESFAEIKASVDADQPMSVIKDIVYGTIAELQALKGE